MTGTQRGSAAGIIHSDLGPAATRSHQQRHLDGPSLPVRGAKVSDARASVTPCRAFCAAHRPRLIAAVKPRYRLSALTAGEFRHRGSYRGSHQGCHRGSAEIGFWKGVGCDPSRHPRLVQAAARVDYLTGVLPRVTTRPNPAPQRVRRHLSVGCPVFGCRTRDASVLVRTFGVRRKWRKPRWLSRRATSKSRRRLGHRRQVETR